MKSQKLEEQELQKLYEHFEPYEKEYSNLDYYNNEIERLSRKKYLWTLFFAVILMSLGACFYGVFALVTLKKAGLFLLSVVGLPGLALFVMRMILMYINSRKVSNYRVKNQRAWNVIKAGYNDYPNCPIGIKYCRPSIIKELHNYIICGRADSIKEAIKELFRGEKINEIYSDEPVGLSGSYAGKTFFETLSTVMVVLDSNVLMVDYHFLSDMEIEIIPREEFFKGRLNEYHILGHIKKYLDRT